MVVVVVVPLLLLLTDIFLSSIGIYVHVVVFLFLPWARWWWCSQHSFFPLVDVGMLLLTFFFLPRTCTYCSSSFCFFVFLFLFVGCGGGFLVVVVLLPLLLFTTFFSSCGHDDDG